jgi:hypothetical protein
MTTLCKILRQLAITEAYAINAPEISFHKSYKKIASKQQKNTCFFSNFFFLDMSPPASQRK